MPSGVNLRLLEQKFAKLEAKERKLSLQQGKNGTTWKLVGLRSGAGSTPQTAAAALVPRHDEEIAGETLYSGVEDLKTRSRGGKAVAADEERAKRQMQRDFISGATFAKARAQAVMQECADQREGVQKAQQRDDDINTKFNHQSRVSGGMRSTNANQLPGLFDDLLASIDRNNEAGDSADDQDDHDGEHDNVVNEMTPISRHPKQGPRVPSPSVEVTTSRSLGESIRAPMRPVLDVNSIKGARVASASSAKPKGDFWGMPSPAATTPSLRPHTSGGIPLGGSRVQGNDGVGSPPSYLSRYRNPHPVNIPRRPMTSSSHTRTAITNISPDGRRDESATTKKGNQSALASLANLRRILAPAIGLPPPPKKPSKFAAKRVLQRPATAGGAVPSSTGGGVGADASSNGRLTAVRDLMQDMHISYPHVPIEALHKDYYYLHIRVVHQSNLQGWVFTVVLTDATHQTSSGNEDRSVPLTAVSSAATGNSSGAMRHTINGVRCNEHKYLVFHPPSGIVLSPIDDIPWVPNAPFLYQRTLRVEVYATQPTKAKVVDIMVKFGNVEE